MKTCVWNILRSSIFNPKDRSSPSSKNKAITNALSCKLNVNEEYKQAFRTKSYIEFTTTNKDNMSSSSPSSSSCLLEPDQELLNDMFRSSNNGGHVHHLLLDYFKTSFEAFKTCQLLLQAVDKTRINHVIVNGVLIKLTTRALMADEDNQYYKNTDLFSSFSKLINPFSTLIHNRFLGLHNTHSELLRKLSIERKESRRKLSLVGFVAAAGLICCFTSSCWLKKKKKKDDWLMNSSGAVEVVVRRMEVAARSTYITMNDMDTLSRMAARLEGEVEHLRVVGEMWLRSSRRGEILKEFIAEEDAIVQQMKQLQQHIYLCFLTINRSRRLVMNQILGL